MRNFSILFLTAIFLTACAKPVATSQPTATFVPSTATKLPTATPLPTETPVPATETAPTVEVAVPGVNVDRLLNIIHEDKIDHVVVDGVWVNGSCQVDETATENDIYGITCPDSVGGKLLYDIAFMNWFYFGKIERKVTAMPHDDDRQQYNDLMKRMQSGDVDAAADLVTTFFAWDPNVAGKDMPPWQVLFFGGDIELPGITTVNTINMPSVNGFGDVGIGSVTSPRTDMPRFDLTDTVGSGWEPEIDHDVGTITIKTGYDYKVGMYVEGNVALHYAMIPDLVAKNNGHSVSLRTNNDYYFEGQKWIAQGFKVKTRK